MPRNIFQNYLAEDAKKELDEYLKKNQLESQGVNRTGGSSTKDTTGIPKTQLWSSTANPFYSGITERYITDMNDGGKKTVQDTVQETVQETGAASTGTSGQETDTKSGLDGYLQAYERYSQLARDNTQRQLDYGLARIEKYLPNYLKSQGLSGQGVAETTYINALNNYNTAAREAEADQLESAMEMAKYKSEVEREQARYDYEDAKATENENYVRGLEEYQAALDYIPSVITDDTTEADVDKLLEAYTYITDAQKNFIKKYAVNMMTDGKWADEEDSKVGTEETKPTIGTDDTTGVETLGNATVINDLTKYGIYEDVDLSKPLEEQGWKVISSGLGFTQYLSPNGNTIIGESDLDKIKELENSDIHGWKPIKRPGGASRNYNGTTVEFKHNGETIKGYADWEQSGDIAKRVRAAMGRSNSNVAYYEGKYYVMSSDGKIYNVKLAE